MILLTGDFHLNECNELNALNSSNLKKFCSLKKISKEDINYLIILGDGGFLFDYDTTITDFYTKWFDKKNFITLVVPGNHENYPAIYNDKRKEMAFVANITGNAVYRISEKVFYLERNAEYIIEGKNILSLGGALSIDRRFRVENITWWKEELLTKKEEDDIIKLSKGKKYDYVFSHTAPAKIVSTMFINNLYYPTDPTTVLYEEMIKNFSFNKWFFGHFHENKTFDKYQCLYKSLEIIK